MTTATKDQFTPPLLALSARAAASAWLNAFLCASQDEEQHTLCRTLSLEFFPKGLHLVGCDGTALFRTWVGLEDATWPDLDEAPSHSVVVMDPDGFGVGFMRALLRVTGEELHAHEELTITTMPADEAATLALGDEFMTERVVLRACGQRIDLRLYEGSYPDWRRLRLGLEAIERMESLTLAPRMFALLGKLKSVGAVDLEFYGKAKHIAFTARGEAEVRGLLMPMRKSAETLEQ